MEGGGFLIFTILVAVADTCSWIHGNSSDVYTIVSDVDSLQGVEITLQPPFIEALEEGTEKVITVTATTSSNTTSTFELHARVRHTDIAEILPPPLSISYLQMPCRQMPPGHPQVRY